ncbi:MAG: glycosyltransferase [Clostridium sp.]|nr:glycosyltransferase [Clostridium sp.]
MGNRKIRILHYGLSSHLGGIETYLYELALNINRELFQFDFLAFDDIQPCFYRELSELNCNFHYITSRRNSPSENKKEIEQLLHKEKYDIVHCHLNSLSYIVPVLLALKNNCRVIVHSHNAGLVFGISYLMHQMNYFRLPKSKIECVAVSDKAGNWMFGEETNITILNNGVDIDKYKYSHGSRVQIRDELKLGDKEVIIHTGAFRKQKNHAFIIDIFAAYLSRHPESILMLAGEGELKDVIKKKVESYNIEKNVIFTGVRNDIERLLSAADKFIFPSLYEGFPISLIEAETSGLYCLSSDRITRQAIIPEICKGLSLDEPVEKWVRELEAFPNIDRSEAVSYVVKLGLDIKTEIDKVESLYKKLYNSIS